MEIEAREVETFIGNYSWSDKEQEDIHSLMSQKSELVNNNEKLE